ncbi:hypothetical protein [Bacillus mojavensis]|uniref:hypothetical protein n=1 Tax=Bacillus mojavensis TaxID=72360 RepID=UPI002DBFF97B|nr:hypothetical protein [Bacillus mojavensis]MEC1671696.1 hypothetical protein [Bacillus mojavensis]
MEGAGREIRLKPNKYGQEKRPLSPSSKQDKGANNTDIDGIYGTKTKSEIESLLK